MAAADFYNQILVASLPVALSSIVAPIVAWVLGRSKISKEVATIDYFNRRLDFLERLNKLHTQLTEGPIRPFLDTEIEHCRAFLHHPPALIPLAAEVTVAGPRSRWAQFFLTQPAVSLRKRIFKGLFRFFFGIAIVAGPLGLIASFVEPPAGVESAWVIWVGFIVFYLGLALLFRLWAR
jgi:hypothetical protein